MTAPTHVTFAGFVYLLIMTPTGVALSVPNAIAMAVASLLPDLDTGASRIGRMFLPLSLRIERRFGHRTLTHAVVFVFSLAVVLLPLALWDMDLYACFCAGYTTHTLLDTATINGVRLFYPFSTVRCVFPMEIYHPLRYRTATGSKLDHALGVIFLLGCIPTFLIAELGYERFVRFAQRNVESAVRDYNEYSRTNRVFATISGHNLLTKEHVAGRFEIVGTLDDQTLLFKGGEGRLHSLGNEYRAEYVAENVLCEKGEAVTISVREADMADQPLSGIGASLEATGEHRFFGSLATSDPFSIPQAGRGEGEFSPITGSSGSLKFNHASYADIAMLGLDNIFVTRGILIVRTIREVRTVSGDSSSPLLAILGGVPGLPFGEYSKVTFHVAVKEPVRFLRGKGDLVLAGDVLARWGNRTEAQSVIALNLQKVLSLERELALKIAGFQQKLAQAEEGARAESTAAGIAGEMERKGFTSAPAGEKSRTRLKKARFELARVQSEAGALRARYEVQIRSLRIRNEQLAMKDSLAETRSEIRSPVGGFLADIRQAVHGGRLWVTILLRKD